MARIAVAGWQHETNSFAAEKATLDAFIQPDAWPGLVEGAALPAAVAGVNIPVAGFIEAAQRAGHEIVPLLWASATPSGPVEDQAYEEISARILAGLARAGPVDALYLDLHGAMVTESLDDAEGEFLRRVRAQVGHELPVAVSLDFHANVSDAMIELADVMVGYRTYPHVDMAPTGARAAGLLDQILAGHRFLSQSRRIPFLIPLVWQCTLEGPMARLMETVASLEAEGVASLSFFPGFPLADARCSAPRVVGYGSDPNRLRAAVDVLEAQLRSARPVLTGKLHSPAGAIALARDLLRQGRRGPVVLADTQDNPGAGGTADTVGLIEALLSSGLPSVAGVLHDPEAAQAAHLAGIGSQIRIGIGARSGFGDERPLLADWVVESIGTGSFVGTGPFYGGCRFDLGPMAVLRSHGLRVVIASRRQQAADQSMFRHVGIDPADVTVIALKSSVHFRADFAAGAQAILIVVSPGANVADLSRLRYRRLAPDVQII